MFRNLFIAAAAFAMMSAPAFAAPCKDAKGKFIKCPPAAAATAKPPAKCRDAKGHFTACGTPGAKPAGKPA